MDCFPMGRVGEMKKFVLTLIFILYTSTAFAVDKKFYKEPLSKNDIKAIYLFNMIQAVDMFQTLEIANNDMYYETNKILGKHPSELQVITYFILRGFSHYEITKMIPEKYRPLWHGYGIFYNYNIVKDNHELGIRINF